MPLVLEHPLRTWLAVLGLLGLITGCGLSAPAGGSRVISASGIPSGAAGQAPAAGGESGVALQAIVSMFSIRRYGVLALVTPYTPADVSYLESDLFREDAIETLVGSQQTTPGSGVSSTVNWMHLKQTTHYRLKVTALGGSGTVLNGGGGPATADITTGLDNQVSAAVQLPLANRVFDGRVHTVVSVTSAGRAKAVSYLKAELSQLVAGNWATLATASTPAGSGLTSTVDFLHLAMNSTFQVQFTLFDSQNRAIASKAASFQTQNDDAVIVNVSF